MDEETARRANAALEAAGVPGRLTFTQGAPIVGRTFAPRVTIEDVLPDRGAFGFLARWEATDDVTRVRMWEWVAKESNGTRLLRRLSDDFDVTTNVDEAELYLSGSIKWDGCSSFDFHDDNTEKHLCGLSAYQDFCAVLRYVWTRAFELMGREPYGGAWGDEVTAPRKPDPPTEAAR